MWDGRGCCLKPGEAAIPGPTWLGPQAGGVPAGDPGGEMGVQLGLALLYVPR